MKNVHAYAKLNGPVMDIQYMVSMFNKMNIQLGDTQSYHIPWNQTERGNHVYNSVLSLTNETYNMTTSCCIFHLLKIKYNRYDNRIK